MRIPADAFVATLAEVESHKHAGTTDSLGRKWTGSAPLGAPYRAVKVTGALFHTQGGLMVDTQARVLRADGSALVNVFAAGGAARGVSGPKASGYLSGNGLLTAVVLGRVAGRTASGR